MIKNFYKASIVLSTSVNLSLGKVDAKAIFDALTVCANNHYDFAVNSLTSQANSQNVNAINGQVTILGHNIEFDDCGQVFWTLSQRDIGLICKAMEIRSGLLQLALISHDAYSILQQFDLMLHRLVDLSNQLVSSAPKATAFNSPDEKPSQVGLTIINPHIAKSYGQN